MNNLVIFYIGLMEENSTCKAIASLLMTIFTHSSTVRQAQQRIEPWIKKTPILSSTDVNQKYGTTLFKAEMFQYSKAFKLRGCLNKILSLQEEGAGPARYVTYSTGNHGIALSWCARRFSIHGRIYMPINTSQHKQDQCRALGGEVIITGTRQEAEERAYQDGCNGYHFIPPSADEAIIAGAGTLLLESMDEAGGIHAVFAACGGGGLLSGCVLARQEHRWDVELIGAEPTIADDAHRSFKSGTLFRFEQSPATVADGLRALGLSSMTFGYIRQLDDMILASEEEIVWATGYLQQSLRVECEPSAAVAFCAAIRWHQINPGKVALVLLSGGNC